MLLLWAPGCASPLPSEQIGDAPQSGNEKPGADGPDGGTAGGGEMGGSADGGSPKPVGDADAAVAPESPLLLDLNFEDGLQDASGLMPAISLNVSLVDSGKNGNGALLTRDSQIEYSAPPKLAAEGSLAMWYEPQSSPIDGQDRFFFHHGDQGILLVKDAADNLRLIANRASPEGYPERGAGIYAGDANIDDGWHHLAATWSATQLVLYVDGTAVDSTAIDVSLYPEDAPVGIGCNSVVGAGADGTLDDVQLYDYALSPDEVLELAE